MRGTQPVKEPYHLKLEVMIHSFIHSSVIHFSGWVWGGCFISVPYTAIISVTTQIHITQHSHIPRLPQQTSSLQHMLPFFKVIFLNYYLYLCVLKIKLQNIKKQLTKDCHFHHPTALQQSSPQITE